jgi:hypothetical protein
LPRPAAQVDHWVHDVAAPASLNSVVPVHGVHVASAVATVDAVKYSPASHVVFQAAHDVAAPASLNSPEGHGVHVASAVATADAVKYSPASHVAFQAAHDVAAPASLNSPKGHGVHVASAVATVDAVKNSPASHVAFQAAHDVAALASLNSPEGHGVHQSFDLNSPAGHGEPTGTWRAVRADWTTPLLIRVVAMPDDAATVELTAATLVGWLYNWARADAAPFPAGASYRAVTSGNNDVFRPT